MATAAQLTANRANAQRSTGPVTPQGKARVARNALKHGLTSTHLVIRIDEADEFAALRDALEAELAPQGAVEIITFREILHASWNLQRFRRLEAEISLGSIDDFTDPQTVATLDRLARCQARAQRAYFRALSELRTLQTNRALRDVKLDEETAAEIPAITDINQFAKQTRSEVTAEAMDLAIRMIELEGGALRMQSMRARKGEFVPVGN